MDRLAILLRLTGGLALLAACGVQEGGAGVATQTLEAVKTTMTPGCCPAAEVSLSTPSVPLSLGPTSSPAAVTPMHARGYFTTPHELEAIKRKADQGLEPYATAVEEELAYARNAYKATAISVPALINIRNREVESPEFLFLGSKRAYAFALAYGLLKESDPALAGQYAQRAFEMVMAMPRGNTEVSGYQANTRLNLSLHVPIFLYAADLLADWEVPETHTPFYLSADNQQLKEWVGRVTFRYSYNVAFTNTTNWGMWGRSAVAAMADYVGNDAPLYAQQFEVDTRGAYVIDPKYPCVAGETGDCVQVSAAEAYATALHLHFQFVDGLMYQFSNTNCDAQGSKSMIRPDGGLPDELRRQYDCDATEIPHPYGAASRYSQHATEAMVALAELAWRRGNSDLYTHIDAMTQRGAIFRSVQFILKNNLYIGRPSMAEMVNRFYTYQLTRESDPFKLAEYQNILDAHLPGILKTQGNWPAGAGFISFGTLTHGFASGETLAPPSVVAPRTDEPAALVSGTPTLH